MKVRLIAIAALLTTLRATGANAPLSPAESLTLQAIDQLPTRAQIDFAVQPAAGLDRLIELASDTTLDLGVQIRSIRLLPLYCQRPGENCGTDPVHDALIAMIQRDTSPLRQPGAAPLPPPDLLRVRAEIEALGATRSGLDDDVAVLTAAQPALLGSPSRDLRVTVVRALRNLGNCKAIVPLQMLAAAETVTQVQNEIVGALQSLQTPPMCPRGG
jgi:hypothetical protein